MSANIYEGTLILDSNRYARDPQGLAAHVKQLIESNGGEVLVSRLWEERRLAYPIGSHRKGTYWVTYFKLPPKNIVKLERDCQLSENVVRSLYIKIDPRIAQTLVAHYSGAAAPTEPKPADGKPTDAKSADGKPAATKPAAKETEAEPVGADA